MSNSSAKKLKKIVAGEYFGEIPRDKYRLGIRQKDFKSIYRRKKKNVLAERRRQFPKLKTSKRQQRLASA